MFLKVAVVFLPPCLDPGWDRWTWNQNLPPSRCRVGWGWRFQRADEDPEGNLPSFCEVLHWIQKGLFETTFFLGVLNHLFQTSIPFAVVGSNQQIEAKGKKVRGRLYPWGVVEVENPEHNDFLKLRTMLMWVTWNVRGGPQRSGDFVLIPNLITLKQLKTVVYGPLSWETPSVFDVITSCKPGNIPFPRPHRTHMQDLQEVTQDLHYENFRSERLKRGGRLSSHGYILPLSPAYVLLSAGFSAPPPYQPATWWD